jgi:hypothetical protein
MHAVSRASVVLPRQALSALNWLSSFRRAGARRRFAGRLSLYYGRNEKPAPLQDGVLFRVGFNFIRNRLAAQGDRAPPDPVPDGFATNT